GASKPGCREYAPEGRSGGARPGIPSGPRILTSRHAHMPGDRRPRRRRDAEIVPSRPAAAQPAEQRRHRPGPAFAQRVAQPPLPVMPEAAIDRPGRGDPDAVAAVAEIVAERRDQAEPGAEPGDLVIARRSAGAQERRREREAPLEPPLDHVERQIVAGAVLL